MATTKKIIKDRYTYSDYFENWKSRLKEVFDKEHFDISIDILNIISKDGAIKENEIKELVSNDDIDLDTILNVLEYDGYINKQRDEFRFNSPILKQWWYENVSKF